VHGLGAFVASIVARGVISAWDSEQGNLSKVARNMSLDVARLGETQVALAIWRYDWPLEDFDILCRLSNIRVVVVPQMLPELSMAPQRGVARGMAEQLHAMGLRFMGEPSIDGIEQVVVEMAVGVSTDVWLEIGQNMFSSKP
jgi:hypothetical protein